MRLQVHDHKRMRLWEKQTAALVSGRRRSVAELVELYQPQLGLKFHVTGCVGLWKSRFISFPGPLLFFLFTTVYTLTSLGQLFKIFLFKPLVHERVFAPSIKQIF